MNSISVLSSDHVQTGHKEHLCRIDSLVVSRQLEVSHKHLLGIIREEISEISTGQTAAMAAVLFIEGVYRDKQGKKQPKYFVSEKGLVLLLLHYPDKKKMAMLLMDRIEKMQSEINAKDKLLLENKVREQETSIKRLTAPQIEVVKTKYGTAFLRKTPLLEKQIVVYRETDDGVKIPDEKCKAQELTGEQLFEAIADNYDAKAYGYERAAIKAHLGAKEYRQWKIKGEGPCPKPSDFKLKSEYEGFFEDLGLLRGV